MDAIGTMNTHMRLTAVGMLLMGLAMSGCTSGTTRSPQPDGEWRRVDTTQTLSFAEAGRISGDTGCNRYSGSMELDTTGSMRIGSVASTKRACAEADKMRAETEFLRSLGKVSGYRFISSDRMILLDSGGNTLLTFEQAKVTP